MRRLSFRAYADSAGDWELWTAPDGKILHSSPSCKKITGYTDSEITSDQGLLLAMTVEEDRKKLAMHLEKEKSASGEYGLEYGIRTKWGKLKRLRHTCRPILDENGGFAGRRVIATDIAEVRTADAAGKNEEQLRRITDTMVDLIAEFDAKAFFKYVSFSYGRILGFEPQELIGTWGPELLHPEERDRTISEIDEMLRKGSGSVRFRYRCRDGSYRWFESTGKNLIDEEGRITGSIMGSRDITDLRREEGELDTLSSRYEAMLYAVPDIIMEVDNDKVYTWANQAGYTFFGPDVIGKEADFYFEGEQDTYGKVRPLFDGFGDVIYVESWQRRKDGEKRLLAWWCRVLKDRKGAITGALSTARDITEQTRAEEELRRSEMRYRRLLHSVTGYIYSVTIAQDTASSTIHGPGCAAVTGYTPDDYAADAFLWYRMIHEDDRQRVERAVTRLLDGKKPVPLEHRIHHRDGSLRWIRHTLVPRLSPTGQLSGYDGLIEDISERKRVEEELYALTARIEALIRVSPLAITLLDTQDNVRMWNPSAEKIFGWTADEAIGHPNPIVPAEKGEEYSAWCGMIAEGQLIINRETVRRRKDGSTIPVSISSAPVHDPAGRPIGRMAIIADITEKKRAEDALRESEEHFRTLVENSLMGIGISCENQVVFANRALLSIFGFDSHEEFIAIPLLDHVSPASKDMIADRMLMISQGQPAPNEFEYEIVRKDGLTRTLRAISSHFTLGGKIYTQTTFQDITESKRSVEALRTSEERFRLMFQNSAAGMVLVDTSFRFLRVNVAFCGMLGYAESELQGKTFQDVTHPDDRTIGADHVLSVLAGKSEGFQLEKRYIRRDGTVVWGLVASTLIRDLSGAPIHFVTQIQDITARKRAEEELRASEERFRLLVENAPDAIFVLVEGRFAYMNPAAGQLFGAPSDREILGTEYLSRVHPDRRTECAGRIARVLAERTAALPITTVYYTLGEAAVDVEVSAVPCVYEGRSAVLVSARDLTERKHAAEERERLEAQLQRAQRLEAVGLLAGGIAHDFNNMLAVIMGYAEALQGELPANSDSQAEIAEILKAATRSSELTQQLLAFARRQTLDMKPLDLNLIIRELQSMLRRSLRENIFIDLRLSPHPCIVSGDQGQIGQVLLNLALNAQYAMPHGGKLFIETSGVVLDEESAKTHADLSAGRYALLVVSDNGVGMDAQTLEMIFEPFFTTKPLGEGTGLGLPTVYGIVKQHGGGIEVHSEAGKGTTFMVHFPMSEEPAVNAGVHEPKGSTRGDETVLVVEDQEDLRKLVCRTLKKLGYTVLEAVDGPTALSTAETYPGRIHIVVTDVIMEGMNGMDLFERLSKPREGIKVVFMSGYAGNVITQYGILDKGMDFIRKPFSSQTLAGKVREVLDRR
jgi:PAS domain S-box-containing protein